jgi:predicted nucleic acid-binding protein
VARLIDSSVLIEIERRNQIDIDFATVAAGESIAAAAITAAEILAGAEVRRSSRDHHRITVDIQRILQHVRVLPFDIHEAQIYAALFTQLRSIGQMVGAFDLLIAATAIANDCSVVTLNQREFKRIPGLDVIAPDW